MDKMGMDTEDTLEPPELLLRYFKHWPLDDLSITLDGLLQDVNSELVQLVNDNYMKFITLGRSLDGSADLTNDIKIAVNGYGRELSAENSRIRQDMRSIDAALDGRRSLSEYRRAIALLQLVDEQLETLVELCRGLKKSDTEKIRHAGALALSVKKQYDVLVETSKQLKWLRKSPVYQGIGRKLHGMEVELARLGLERERLME